MTSYSQVLREWRFVETWISSARRRNRIRPKNMPTYLSDNRICENESRAEAVWKCKRDKFQKYQVFIHLKNKWDEILKEKKRGMFHWYQFREEGLFVWFEMYVWQFLFCIKQESKTLLPGLTFASTCIIKVMFWTVLDSFGKLYFSWVSF